MSTSATPSSEEPSFEQAMGRLEAIVEQMESGDLPLEDILSRYEEGTRLVRYCGTRLAAAEKRIGLIAKNAAGEPTVVDFEEASPENAAPEPPRKERSSRTQKSAPSAPREGSDEVSLF